MGDCPLKSVDRRSSQSTAIPGFSRVRSRKLPSDFTSRFSASRPWRRFSPGKFGSNCLPYLDLPFFPAEASHAGISHGPIAQPGEDEARVDAHQCVPRYIVTIVEGAIMQGRTLGAAALLRRQFACSKEYLTNRLTT